MLSDAPPRLADMRLAMHGDVAHGFESVADAFADNFRIRNELGAACCMYVDGQKVVDLWGGIRNHRSGAAWQQNTMVIVWSATKGMSGLAMALANSRGWLEFDAPVSHYWPEFGQAGKGRITVRQLLSHQAGLFALDERVDRSVLADPDRLAGILARQKPEWQAGERQAYSMLSLGFYESELLRRVDPDHRTLGKFFRDEIAERLGLDFYIGLPAEIPNSQLAAIENASPLDMVRQHHRTIPWSLLLAVLNPHSPLRRSDRNPDTGVCLDPARVYARDLEVPAGGGVGTARAMARAYGAYATGGRELGLRQETLSALMAPATAPRRGFHDECLKVDWQLSLGFAKPCDGMDFGSSTAFGMPGFGGSFAYADPGIRSGYAYVTNRMGPPGGRDPRELAIHAAFERAVKTAARSTEDADGVTRKR